MDPRNNVRPAAQAALRRASIGRGAMPGGTQSIQRASLLVRLIASHKRAGLRLTDLVQLSRLERPTVRRILKCLIAEGMVTQIDETHRYFLGPLVFELGLAATPRFNLRELCRPALQRIADRSGDTAFLSVRSGYDSVCLDRAEGSFPIKALTLDVGIRRPLGVGAGGLALVMALPADAIDDILTMNEPRLAAYHGASAATLRRLIARARDTGYALNDDHITAGATSLGLPVINPHGEPFASVSVGAIASRLSPKRRPEVVAILRGELEQLGKALTETTTPK